MGKFKSDKDKLFLENTFGKGKVFEVFADILSKESIYTQRKISSFLHKSFLMFNDVSGLPTRSRVIICNVLLKDRKQAVLKSEYSDKIKSYLLNIMKVKYREAFRKMKEID